MSATRTTEISMTRLTPNRSASRPTIGLATPKITPLIDQKPEIAARFHWNSELSGLRKVPKA
jgi:hypothetical protein